MNINHYIVIMLTMTGLILITIPHFPCTTATNPHYDVVLQGEIYVQHAVLSMSREPEIICQGSFTVTIWFSQRPGLTQESNM